MHVEWYNSYSVSVKAIKAFSSPVIVRCDYYYYITNGGYTYQKSGSYDFKITVSESGGTTSVKPTKITVPNVVSVEVGESKDITATVIPENAQYTLTWSINDKSIATVDNNGTITGKSVGYADLKVQADNGVYAMCRVAVYKPKPTSVSMKSSVTLYVGDTYTLSPSVYPVDSEYTLTWSSDNSSVVAVSQSGVLNAKSAGTANITVKTSNGKYATCKVSVLEKIVTINLYYDIGEGGYMTSFNSTYRGANKIGVGKGDDIHMKFEADAGYHIDSVKLDGVDVKPELVDGELSVMNMTQDRYLVVRFVKDTVIDIHEEYEVTTDNTLSFKDVTAYVGDTVSFTICMNNVDEITAFQMDLCLPEGIQLISDESGDVVIETSDRVSNKHSLVCNQLEDGSYRFICYSTNNNVFAGNDGELFSVTLSICDDVENGSYEIKAYNIELSDKTGKAYMGQDINGLVTVKSYMIGDTDNNGKHSINDAVCIINHILNQPNAVFIESAADLDGNGRITVNDAVLLISKYILGNTDSSRAAKRSSMVDNGENYMSIEDLSMQPGEVKTVEVKMNNERDDIKGLQCDITLPQGFSFIFDDVAEDYVVASARVPAKLTLSSEMQSENILRVAGVSMSTTGIYGNSGAVFSFKVKADTGLLAGKYEIQLSNVELSYGESITVADRNSVIEILSETSGIENILFIDIDDAVIYNLSGQKVDASNAKNGIFIVDGKKVYVK